MNETSSLELGARKGWATIEEKSFNYPFDKLHTYTVERKILKHKTEHRVLLIEGAKLPWLENYINCRDQRKGNVHLKYRFCD